jgi:hypothetical protein
MFNLIARRDQRKSSPRHAQTGPIIEEIVGSPLDQEIEGSNPSSPASCPTGSNPWNIPHDIAILR